jgi:hypothetical protein
MSIRLPAVNYHYMEKLDTKEVNVVVCSRQGDQVGRIFGLLWAFARK